jgi:hypothetical protein
VARAVLPVFPLFLDLPLLDGTEVPHAPHVAVAADPWPGPVAVWSSASDAGYGLNRLIGQPATLGVTESELAAARAGLFDRGAGVRVRFGTGALASAGVAAVLNGANVAVIGAGGAAGWEVVQFTTAVLVEPEVWELGGLLRGQAGSEADMLAVWPVGSYVVLMDGAPEQIELALAARGLDRYYRIAASQVPLDDPAVVARVEAFDGIGLRPYRPVHLKAQVAPSGQASLSWIRRTRIDGDGWLGADVPLGEDREAYLVRVRLGGAVVREVTVATPAWVYPAALRAADGTAAGFTLQVAQVSDRFGPGPFAQVVV